MALYKFGENDIYLPLAVIDDLDDIKTRPGNISWSAREVFRILDKIDLKLMVDKGVIINEEKGKLFIYNTEAPLTKNETPNIVKVNSDNAIINAAISLKNKFPNRPVTIITKDTGLRVRANAWGCHAENYQVDQIDTQMYTGIVNASVDNEKDWNLLDAKRHFIPDSFEFMIETVGPYTNMEIMYKAAKLMIGKLERLQETIQGDPNIIMPSETTIPNSFDIVIKNEDYTLGKVIEFILYAKHYDESLDYCGFRKPHPHIDEIVIRVGFKNPTEKVTVATYFVNAAVDAIRIYEKIGKTFEVAA